MAPVDEQQPSAPDHETVLGEHELRSYGFRQGTGYSIEHQPERSFVSEEPLQQPDTLAPVTAQLNRIELALDDFIATHEKLTKRVSAVERIQMLYATAAASVGALAAYLFTSWRG